jgi:hypothetical protein
MRSTESLERHHWPQRLAAAAMPVCLALLWPLLRPYDWLNRDGQLYAVQAVSRAHPDRFANDLFFLFGSQDQFTILTTLIAPLYDRLGVDHASALLTVLGSLLWWGACWLLAKSIAGPRIAWLSLAVVMSVPGWYGGGEVFRFAETYFSARLPAEGLVLLALALQQMRRPALGCVALVTAFAIHPLMTLPGLALFALLQLPSRRWSWLLLIVVAAFVTAIVVAAVAPFGRLQWIDPEWMSVLKQRSSFLFPATWTIDDWCRTGAVFATLLAAARLIDDLRVKRFAFGAAIVGAGGLLAAVITARYAPVALLLQVQPWRALWLATVIASLLVPLCVVSTRHADTYARSSSILLVAAVCSLSPKSALAASGVALALALLSGLAPLAHGRMILNGARAALALTVIFALMSALTVTQVPAWGGASGAMLEHIRNSAGLTVPGLLLALGIWGLTTAQSTWLRTSIAFLALASMAWLTTSAVAREFLEEGLAGKRYAQFADWRATIPPGVNVLWPSSPAMVWFVLERPSYLSVVQSAGVIFSRNLAIEGMQRARFLSGYADTDWLMGRPMGSDGMPNALTEDLLHKVCSDRRIGFVIDPERVSIQAPSLPWPDSSHRIYLYDCNSYRDLP